MDLGWAGVAAFGFGIASALIPVLNAEVYVVGLAAASSRQSVWLSLILMALGTTVGKVVIFESARHGSKRFKRRRDKAHREGTAPPRTRLGRRVRVAGDVLLTWLAHPVLGPVTVLIAAFVGVPPLLLVAALAGVSRIRVGLFAAAVLVGRLARFATIAWPVLAGTS